MDMSRPEAIKDKLLPPPRSLGAILIKAGRLSPAQAERILQLQEQKGIRFGEAAYQRGILDDVRLPGVPIEAVRTAVEVVRAVVYR